MKKILVFICIVSSLQSYEKTLSKPVIDFQQSMNIHPDHDIQFSKQDERWKYAQSLYEEHIKNNIKYAENPRIPLIVHHIWIGSSLPKYAQDFRQTWIDHNPEWTFIFWTDHPSAKFGAVLLESFEELIHYLENPNHEQFIMMDMRKVKLKNQKVFNRGRNYGEKSDIARYEILYNIGGLYVDTDFECFKAFDELHYCSEFYVGIAHDKKFYLHNSLIASARHCPIMAEAVDGLSNRPHYNDTLLFSGPYYLADCFIKSAPAVDGPVIPFPVTFFHPWPHHFRKQVGEAVKKWIKPESFAMHYWKVSWLV